MMVACSRIRNCHDLKNEVKASVDLKCWPRYISDVKSKVLNLCNCGFHFCIDFVTSYREYLRLTSQSSYY